MIRETPLAASDLIRPYFVLDGKGRREPIASMPGIDRLSIDLVIDDARELHAMGVPAIILFPYVEGRHKDARGSEACNPNGTLPTAVRAIKEALPELCVIADIALDPYTTHGHDGLLNERGEVLNDPTVEILAEWAVMLAAAGVDMVAPSDMMDGRVGAIRRALDLEEQRQVSIMAYSAKYASAFYGPFRDALHSAPQFGDKKTYQMDPANAREAIRECLLDEEEGADFLMVKPAMPYLDIITRVREQTTLPIAAYQVSGEYAMIQAAAQNGWLDGDRALFEAVLGIKRAGADMILTYGARKIVELLQAQPVLSTSQ